MKKRFNKYYIGYIPKETQSELLTTDELHNEPDSYYKNVSLNVFTSIGMHYALDIPTISGIFSHTNLIGSNDVLKYNSLSELLDDFIFGFDSDEESDFSEDDDSDENNNDFDVENGFHPEERIGVFLEQGDFVIIKQNIKSKKYSLVDRDTIFNCFEQLMDKLENDLVSEGYNKYDESKYVLEIDRNGLEKLMDNFHETLEKHIEQDSCQVTVSADTEDYYLFSIIKKDSKLEKDIIKDGEYLEKENSRGFIFDGTYKDYISYVLHNLKQGIPLGCAVTTVVTDYDVKDQTKIFTKCYGYVIGFKDNEVIINQLPAKEVAKGNTFNLESGKELESRRNIIYCGFKKDDIVCGFDL